MKKVNSFMSEKTKWELRALKAEEKNVGLQNRINVLEIELNNMLLLHRYEPSEMRTRIKKVLNLSD